MVKKIIRISPLLILIIIGIVVINGLLKYVSPIRVTELSEVELKSASNEFGIEISSNNDFREISAISEAYELYIDNIESSDELIDRLIIDIEDKEKFKKELFNNAYIILNDYDKEEILGRPEIEVYWQSDDILIKKRRLNSDGDFYKTVNKWIKER